MSAPSLWRNEICDAAVSFASPDSEPVKRWFRQYQGKLIATARINAKLVQNRIRLRSEGRRTLKKIARKTNAGTAVKKYALVNSPAANATPAADNIIGFVGS